MRRHFGWMSLGAFALSVSLQGGCAVENPDHVEDSTGAEMGWGCVNGNCSTVRESFSAPVPECSGDDTELLVGAGGLAVLCAVSLRADGVDVVHDFTCRPLVCADDLDCPQWSERAYTCVESLCQTSLAFDPLDVLALCLWDIPRHDGCMAAGGDPLVQERLSLVTEACDGEACEYVPEPCLQP